MFTVELKRRGKKSAIRFDCLAVVIDDKANLYAVTEEGARVRLAWRLGEAGSAWRARDGSKVYPPLIHDSSDTSVLHYRGDEYAYGEGPWTFQGRPDTYVLSLRRRSDSASSAGENFCYLGLKGWAKLATDISGGEPEIMIAPAGFSLEQLYIGLAGKGTRGRLSVLAG
jgi:hypothetical protein